MNESSTDLETARFDTPLHEPDIAHEIAAVLRALSIVLAILLATLLVAGTIQPLAEWTRLHLSLLGAM